jgi:hypothetical protein
MTTIDRRTVLRAAAVTAGGAALGGPLAGFLALPAQAERTRPDFRNLRAIPDQRDGVVRLWLPENFSYRSFHDTTDPTDRELSDGTRIPGRHDGMAAFPGTGGSSVLIRNHEINDPAPAPFSATAPAYDSRAGGGTTSVVVDGEGNVAESWASLAGTMMNCSGGPMPWEAWVTCEETVNGPDIFDDFTRGTLPPTTYIKNAQLTRPHGFVFEVPVEGAASAQPIRKAGRFAHEAIAVDPVDGAAYLTEDDFGFPSGFFKYVPPVHPMQTGGLADGGQLFMLAVEDKPNAPRRSTTWPARDGRRARPTSAGSRERSTTTTSSTSAPPRAVATPRTRTSRRRVRTATARDRGRSGPTTAAPASSSCSTRHPTATPSTFPTTSPRVRVEPS